MCPAVHKETGEVVAVKTVDRAAASATRIQREADIMRLSGEHRNVVQFLDLFSSESHWHIVMEMAAGGELFDRLVTRGPYTELQASHLIKEARQRCP